MAMNFKILGYTVDKRTGANVLYAKSSVKQYFDMVINDFENFPIQRKRENHKAYKRLKDDLRSGALLPSITLALKPHVVDEVRDIFDDENKLTEFLLVGGNLDILDGLQRTYIIRELIEEGHDFPEDQEVLLECWIEGDMKRLIYRMIVLNAGQKAMSIRHQIELLFMSLKETIVNEISGIEIFSERDGLRRTRSNKYQLNIIAASYQAFLIRNVEVDKNDIVSSNLVKDNVLDSSEAEHAEKFQQFINYFKVFKEIDSLAWRYYEDIYNEARVEDLKGLADISSEESHELSDLLAFQNGKSWLGGENVMLAFFCAVSIFINNGRQDRVDEALASLKSALENREYDPLGLISYEKRKSEISPRKTNIGSATRKLLLTGFKEYFRDDGHTRMANCWEQAFD